MREISSTRNGIKLLSLIGALCLWAPSHAQADCVLGAKTAMKYQILDNHTILLSGGVSGSILIKSFAFFSSGSEVAVLKDDFCDFEDAVLYVDGEAVDAQQVKQIR